MVKVKEDLTGKKFERWTVIKQVEDNVLPSGRHVAMWLCECSCKDKNKAIVRGDNLKSGATKSCGCLQKELASKIRKKKNKFDVKNYPYGVGLTGNTNREFYFDLNDYDKIKNYYWIERINKQTGGRSLLAKINGKYIRMHSFLGFKRYDHKNRNPFDNRKENLRPATLEENARNHSLPKNNTSGFSGVCFDARSEKWRAYITVNNKHKDLGYFADKLDAIITRLYAELKYFGLEFAPQRHLFEEYGVINNTKL